MHIRPVRVEEYEAVAALTVAAYDTIDGLPLGDYREVLRNVAVRATDSVVLVAVTTDDALLGAVTYIPDCERITAEFDDPAAAGIRFLAVDPNARHAGVGAALVRACLARARSDRRHRVVLHTTTWMSSAQRLYARLGFHREPSLDFTVGADEDDLDGGVDLLGYAYELTVDAPAR